MNKWFRRAVGTVGIAGGILLLGAGAAHADDSVPAAKDPQQLNGLFDELMKPTGGPSNLGLSLDTPGNRRLSTGLVPGGPLATSEHHGQPGAVAHTPALRGLPRDPFVNAPIPGVLGNLPISSVDKATGLGDLAPNTEGAVPSLPANAPNLPLLQSLMSKN